MKIFVRPHAIALLIIAFAIMARSQNLKADYQFQGNLTSAVAGAPAMTNLTGSGGANSFVTDSVDGYTRQTVRFPLNSGLSVSTALTLIPNNAYTIVTLFRFDAVTDFRRIVDFSNGVSDFGAYVKDGRIDGEVTTNPAFSEDTYIQVAIVREVNGTVRVYRDGELKVTLTQDTAFQIGGANTLRFFQDDFTLPTEASAGNVARIRLFDAPMTIEQIQALNRVPETTPTSNSVIVFSSQRDGNDEIYVSNSDGSNQIRLSNNAAADRYPAWSPDGTKIAFHTNRDGGQSEIYVMNRDGSAPLRLTNDPAADVTPHWSPDGAKIVFRSTRDGNAEIYAMNADGTNQTRLTNNAAADDIPSWSPNGQRICFMSARDGNQEMYVMDANGSNQTRLTSTLGNENECSWSPEGHQLAFWSDRDGNPEIYSMDADGSNQKRLTNNPASDTRPTWSADGTRILFASARSNNFTDLWTINSANGAAPTRMIVNSANELSPAWYRATRTIRVVNTSGFLGQTILIPIQIDSLGNENSASFTLNFNPAVFGFTSGALGSGVPMEGSVSFNDVDIASGRLGVLIDSTGTIAAGQRQIFTLGLTTVANAQAGTYPITFSDTPTPKSVSNVPGVLLPTFYEAGQLTLTAGTFSVSGRVTTPSGQILRSALITLIDPAGVRRTAVSSPFGLYQFDGLQTGSTYTMTISNKRFRFLPKVFTVTGANLVNVDFVGLE